MSKMSLEVNDAPIRTVSSADTGACGAYEDSASAGNALPVISQDEFFLGSVTGKGVPAEGFSPLVCRGFTVFLFSTGSAEIRINGTSYQAGAGTVAAVITDEIAELENVSADCICTMVSAPSETVIDFPSPADSDILTMTMVSPVFTVPDRKMALAMEYCRLMQTVNADRDNVFRWEIMKSVFYSMMLEVCDAYRQYGTVVGKSALLRHERLGDDLFRLLSRHCRTHRSVSFYAEKLNITPKYLSREIKRISPGVDQPAYDNGDEEAAQYPRPYRHADIGGYGLLQPLRLCPVLQTPHRHHPSQVPQIRPVNQLQRLCCVYLRIAGF